MPSASNGKVYEPSVPEVVEYNVVPDTNVATFSQGYYGMQQPPYQCKCAPFETVDELRLLYGADMDTLIGEDLNRNGVLDPNENDENHNGLLDPGVLECVTVYSREPNTHSDGSPLPCLRSPSTWS